MSPILELVKKVRTTLFPDQPEMPCAEKHKVFIQYKDTYRLNVLIEMQHGGNNIADELRKGFRQLYTIQYAADEINVVATASIKGRQTTVQEGSISKVLKDTVEALQEPALIWLDGSCHSNAENADTSKEDSDSTGFGMYDELDSLLTSSQMNVICINDARLFKGKNGYPSVEQIEDIVRNSRRPYMIFVREDMIHILPVV